MPEPKKIQALADGGPLNANPNLTVDDHDSEGRWPSPVVWRTRPGLDGRHVYVLSHMSDAGYVGFLPTYRFERTLGPSELNPLAGRAKPA